MYGAAAPIVTRPRRRRGGSRGRSAGHASRPRVPPRISSSGRRDRRARWVGCRGAPPTRDPRPSRRRAAPRPQRPRARRLAPRAPRSPRRARRRPRRASREGNASPPSRVEFHLVEETKHGVARPYPALQRAKLVVGRLTQRPLDREPREVEVLLYHHRREEGVDLDHLLAHELDAEEPLEAELSNNSLGLRDELRCVERDEVHAEPA